MSFRDPIAAGEQLVIPGLQSDNYAAGSAGWRVERDGDAEFNDATIRGALVVSDGTRSITIDTPGSLAQILFEVLGSDVARMRVDSGVSPPEFYIDAFDGANIRALLHLAPGSRFVRIAAPSTTDADDAVLYIQAGETARISQFIEYAPTVGGSNARETWHNLSLQNGWSSSTQPKYKLCPDGRVELRGVIQGGTTADGTVIATLPAGYRPTSDSAGSCITTASNAIRNGHVEIQTDGDLVIGGVGGVGTFLGLNGISFMTI